MFLLLFVLSLALHVFGGLNIVDYILFQLLGDRGKGVPSFDEMMDIALVEVDFDDPTTNVR